MAMELLLKGVVRRIHINDLNPSVHAFWYCVLNHTDDLVRTIRSTPANMDTWHKMRAVQSATDPEVLDLAFSTFFMNRTNRSGILRAGVIGGKNQTGPWKLDARYNTEDLIQRIELIADNSSKIHLHHEDAERLVRRLATRLAKKSFIYFDPPYFVKGQDLYMNHYKNEDHEALASTVAKLPKNVKWMVSYDHHPFIASLYRKFDTLSYTLSYSAAERQKGAELIFFSKGMLVPAPIMPMRPLAHAQAA